MSRWQVTVADPGSEANPAVLDVNGGRFADAVNDTGTANVEVWTRDLKAAGLLPVRGGLAGMWLTWRHRHWLWRGKVTATRTHGSGVTEVVAKDFSVLLDARHTPKVSDTGMAGVGDVFRRAAEDRYRASDPTRLNVDVGRGGPAVPAIQRAADLLDLLRSLQRASGWEWRVDHATRTLSFHPRVGRDKSAEVVLTEGAELVDYDDAFDLEAVFNELLAVPAEEPYQRTRALRVRDEASISAYGLRQAVEVLAAYPTRAGIKSVAEARLRQLKGQGDTVTVVLDGGDDACARFAGGDSVEVRLPSANARYRARAMVSVYDLETDRFTVSCEIEGVL